MKIEEKWTSVLYKLPTEGVVVQTMISDDDGIRNVAKLKRAKNLWWFADGSMYVYYNPTHWKL
jgi:hypothetical protein